MKLTKDYLRKLIKEVQQELKLKSLIREQLENDIQESEASDEAHKKGLESAGFGRWKDKSGKVVATTKSGKLEMKPQNTPEIKKNDNKNLLDLSQGPEGKKNIYDKLGEMDGKKIKKLFNKHNDNFLKLKEKILSKMDSETAKDPRALWNKKNINTLIKNHPEIKKDIIKFKKLDKLTDILASLSDKKNKTITPEPNVSKEDYKQFSKELKS